ncbi:MAG: glutamate racemase, partial [Clostridiales bacterium]|nr:glutamate racemase [Clostridiales bacterium]
HYPLIRSNIERRYPDLRIIDPSEEIAGSIEGTLKKNDMLAEAPETENIFYASDLSENFVRMIDRIFMHSDVNVEFKNLDLEEI